MFDKPKRAMVTHTYIYNFKVLIFLYLEQPIIMAFATIYLHI